MKLIVFLSGHLLLFLLLHGRESLEEQKINLTTLGQIIEFFELNYTEKNKDGDPKPYAVAINVPRNQCQEYFDQDNFLTHVKPTDVKNGIYISTNECYEIHNDLKAAGCLNCKSSHKCSSKPVFDLLANRNSTFTQLLNHRNDGCVVIYTVYTPCQNMPGKKNITPALEDLKEHSGIKAFVFKTVCEDGNHHHCSHSSKKCTEFEGYDFLYHFVNGRVIPIAKLCY